MKILIGSKALEFWFPIDREPKDIDYVGDYDEIKSVRSRYKSKICYPINDGKTFFMSGDDRRIIEFEVAWEGSMAERFLEFAKTFPEAFKYSVSMDCHIPKPNVLYLLKMSHRYKKDSPHFLKTMEDIRFLRSKGCVIEPQWEEFFYHRCKDTYTNALPKLNQSKADFFDNSTSIYTIDHDSIHEAVKHFDKPAYEYFKPDTNEVMCSKDLFFSQPREIQLMAGLEESYVLSIERAIHPYPNTDRKKAFDTALMKLCTSISSGWFREFCWENYWQIQNLYNVEYVERFYEALNNGKIKPFEGK
jgi:hypothetical protein